MREIKEEYKRKKGFQVQEIKKKISRDKRKKEQVLKKEKKVNLDVLSERKRNQ